MADRFRIQLFSDGARSEEIVGASDVHEHLRHIGLEWKTADYFHTRTAVVVIEPHHDDSDLAAAEAKIRAAAEALNA